MCQDDYNSGRLIEVYCNAGKRHVQCKSGTEGCTHNGSVCDEKQCLGGFEVTCDDGLNIFCDACAGETEADCEARCPTN